MSPAFLFRPNGAPHASPGQRPGSRPTHHPGALKGRPKRGIISRSRPPHGPPLQVLCCWGDGVPGPLPQAGVDAAPLGLWSGLSRINPALLFRPNGASHTSPGQRPGSSPAHHPGALKGRPNRGIISRPAPPLGPPLQGLGDRGARIPGGVAPGWALCRPFGALEPERHRPHRAAAAKNTQTTFSTKRMIWKKLTPRKPEPCLSLFTPTT
jgi:hypothetical protein